MAPKSAASPASSASTSASGSDEEEEVAAPPKSAAPKPSPTAAPAPKPDSSSSSSAGETESSDDEADPSPPKPAAAVAAAGGSETESGSETGPESDDEPAAAATPKPADAASSSGDELSSSDESESDSAPAVLPRHSVRVADPAVKPLASKPMPPKPAAASETPAGKHFHRIWSDEDELALLTGIVNYKASTGIVPSTNSEIEPFKDVIRKSLRVEVTTTQLGDKVRHLKRKYDTRAKNPPQTFAKPHDAAVYELSQKVWGAKRDRGENGDASGSKAKKRQKSGEVRAKTEKEAAVVAVGEGGDDAAAAVAEVKVKVQYPYFTDAVLRMGDSVQSRFLVKEAIESVDDVKAMALERKYKKLKLQQMKSNVRELDLNKEALKAVADAMEKLV